MYCTSGLCFVLPVQVNIYTFSFDGNEWILLLLGFLLFLLLLIVGWLYHTLKQVQQFEERPDTGELINEVRQLNSRQLSSYFRYRKNKLPLIVLLPAFFSGTLPAAAQELREPTLWDQAGIGITVILLLIPILAGLALMVIKARTVLSRYRRKQHLMRAEALASYLDNLKDPEILQAMEQRQSAQDYHLTQQELSGPHPPTDERGLIQLITPAGLPVVARKKSDQKRPKTDPRLARLVTAYLLSATCWLLLGTTAGQYLGIKFLAPDADQLSWLSFGRLRPVHTNTVFWGWASLAMLGLAYYIVPRVGNNKLYSIKWGWYSLLLINATVILGNIALLAGINNGGGEYREYIWPVMSLFAAALVLTLSNFLKTVAQRVTREIYIANWYIIAAIIFAITITVVAYLPFWQDGLGETIIQGYYMHQGVGMWFMFFTLGIVYYFLPQQLNRPIYSYSLGILAFWTQILFYTLIGTHHFVFSAIPWWLQTVAIVGSAGMVIPVVAGTTNFLMTFKGGWYKVSDSYTLPFFLAGIIFYFTGSMQGTAEAFRYSNLLWHFTDFTVAHSHLTMYGIISFLLWAGIYAVMPRLTGKEPPQITIGAHFWLALIGLLFYSIPLMYGGTLRGISWMDGKPFMESVITMAPYWLWRAIGGSLMWLSHLFFAYNVYSMLSDPQLADVRETAIKKLEEKVISNNIVSDNH